MSKRGRKEEKPFGMKWKSIRVNPTVTADGEITNAMETELKQKEKIFTLSDFITAEEVAQRRTFEVMGCNKVLSNLAWDALKAAYQSAGKRE